MAPFPSRWQRIRTQLSLFHVRDYWWKTLDLFEESRAWRLALYFTISAMLLVGAAWFWAYPRWTQRNAIRIAQQWLEAGQLRNAAEAAQHAAEVAPDRPEPWAIAAELARRGGQPDKALEYARRATELAPTDANLIIAWAAAALVAELPKEATAVLERLSADQLHASPHAQRILGEIARRESRLTNAKTYFEQALQLEGSLAINEVPLALVLIQSTDRDVRQRGLHLLSKWTDDLEWGPTALRLLISDARERNDASASLKWAETLRTHPKCTMGDMPIWMLAMVNSDETRFHSALAELEKNHAVSPEAAAQLLGWLNQIGRSGDAVRWMKTLPPEPFQQPPLAVLGAEALRATGDWPGLQAWINTQNWGQDAEFLRWAYGLQAARHLGDQSRADELRRSIYSHAQLDGVHALFAAATIYSWGETEDALALWWRAAEQEGTTSIQALGSLARHYQVRQDAEGQYRVFRRLHSLQPRDAAIGNNFAFFAALTGREQHLAERVARASAESDPTNLNYTATYAFTMLQQSRIDAALKALRPQAAKAVHNPGLAFVYGLALAKNGDKTAARALLDTLPPSSLTLAEIELIRQNLTD